MKLPLYKDAHEETIFHDDPHTGGFIIETIRDVTPIVEDNKAEYASIDERARYSSSGIGGKVATIPAEIVQKLMTEGIWGDQKAMKRWLNDPDNRCFRTRPGWV